MYTQSTDASETRIYGAPLGHDPYERRQPIPLADRDPAVATRIQLYARAKPAPWNALHSIGYKSDAEASQWLDSLVRNAQRGVRDNRDWLAAVGESEEGPTPVYPRAMIALARDAVLRSQLTELRQMIADLIRGRVLCSDAERAKLDLLKEIEHHEMWPRSENNEPLGPLMERLLRELQVVPK